MQLPDHKTKIVCTIGPRCAAPETLKEMILSGMNVARINLSHGNPAEWVTYIERIRQAETESGRVVEIFVDLPGAKIRVGQLPQPVMLKKGETAVFASDGVTLAPGVIPVEYPRLAESVKAGDKIFLNDGFIELKVAGTAGHEVRCTVVVGGTLTSHKGVNLPGAKLTIEPITQRDLDLVDFALEHGVGMFGISFVTRAEDVLKVKRHAQQRGRQIFAIAKIEGGFAVNAFEEILNVADGIMVARGDLGVEMPIAEVPAIQKKLIARANLMGRPVITATQMLESMKSNTRPTRAEVSDVANAIFDGTDAVMLSEETAMGDYPVETVRMMASIAVAAEAERREVSPVHDSLRWYLKTLARQGKLTIPDVIARNSVVAAEVLNARYIMIPTDTGGTPRRVSRYKPQMWILAFSGSVETCRRLALSYGVQPFLLAQKAGEAWHLAIIRHLRGLGLIAEKDHVVLAQGGFTSKPGGTDSMEIITVDREMMGAA